MIVSIPDRCLQSSLRWSLGHGCVRPESQQLRGRPWNDQLQLQRGFCNIVQGVIALLRGGASAGWSGPRPSRRIYDDAVREALLGEELTLREGRRVRAALKMGRLLTIKTLTGFDFAFQPSLDRNRILTLAQLEFIDRHEVVHFIGQPDRAS
jgi:hypothetical protein